MMALSPLFQGIQVGCLIVSLMLLSGAFYGMAMRAGDMSPDMLPRWPRESGSSDKRRVTRMSCNLFVELLQDEKVAGTGRLVNLSASGACFVSNSVLQTGDFIMARLPGLRHGANKISGQIVWYRMTPTNSVYGIRLQRQHA